MAVNRAVFSHHGFEVRDHGAAPLSGSAMPAKCTGWVTALDDVKQTAWGPG